MRFPDPLIKATLLKRYKRFLADVRLEDGQIVTVHCPNPGSMTGNAEPGSEVWLSSARNPARKLKYTWEMIRVGDHLVGVNTAHPNGLVEEAIRAGLIPELAGYDNLRREIRYGENSRIDLLLEGGGGRASCHVEVKSVTLKRAAAAEFPDAVTARGAKHLRELAKIATSGGRAVMVFLVQRMDCGEVSIAGDIDPIYAKEFSAALTSGVEALCYSCRLTTWEIAVDRRLDLRLEPDLLI
jgi:sugar fermentation stimulation protein A